MFSDFFQQIIGFLVVILLARKLSPDGYGFYNLILSTVTIFGVIAHFGMSTVVIRELSLKPKKSASFLKKFVIPFRFLSFIFSLCVFMIYNNYTSTIENHWIIYLMLMILNISLWDFSESIAFGHEVTRFSSILNVITSILWLTAILLVPEKMLNVHAVVIIYCFLHFIKAFSYLIIVTNNFIIGYNEQESHLGSKKFLKMSLPYVWLLILVTLSNQLPFQFLNLNSNHTEIGFYSVGFKLMIPISIAVGTGFKAVFPALTRLYSINKKEFQNKIKLAFDFIIIFGTLIAIITSTTSHYWIPFLFGENYIESITVFNFLIWFSVFSILDSLLSNGLSAAYKEQTLALIATIDVVIIIPFLYYASNYGANGLAIIKLILGAIFFLYHLIIFVRVLKVKIIDLNFMLLISFYLLSLLTCLLVSSIFLKLLFLSFFVLFVIMYKKTEISLLRNQIIKKIKNFTE